MPTATKQRPTDTAFDLNSVIHEEMQDNTSPDPRVLAAAVANRVPESHLRSALADALLDRVRRVIRWDRSDTTGSHGKRWDSAAKHYAAILDRRESIDGNEWKHFRDCTYEDVLTIIEVRHRKAAENEATAKRYQKVADAMKARKARLVVNLPEADLLAAMA